MKHVETADSNLFQSLKKRVTNQAGELDDKLLHQFYSKLVAGMDKDYRHFLSETDLLEFVSQKFLFFWNNRQLENRKKRSQIRISENNLGVHGTEVEVLMFDRPFTSNSLLGLFIEKELRILHTVHFVINREDQTSIFYSYYSIQKSEYNRSSIVSFVEELIEDIYYVTDDFKKMLTIGDQQFSKWGNPSMGNWLNHNNFVYLGISQGDKTWGLLRNKQKLQSIKRIAPEVSSKENPYFTQTDLSTIINRKGKIFLFGDNEILISGMFTRKADHTSTEDIPVFMDMNSALEKKNISHLDYRELIYTMNLFPVSHRLMIPIDEFLYISRLTRDARYLSKKIVSLRPGHDCKLHLVILWPLKDFSEGYFYDLKQFLFNESWFISDEIQQVLPNIIFIYLEVDTCTPLPSTTGRLEELEKHLYHALLSWEEILDEKLKNRFALDDYTRVAKTIAPYIPENYKSLYQPEEVLHDMGFLLSYENQTTISIEEKKDQGFSYIKLATETPYSLSYLVPILGGFGLHILSQEYYTLVINEKPVHFYKFHTNYNNLIVPEKNLINIAEGLKLVFEEKVSSEPLNALLVKTNLTIYQVELLKALVSYLVQVKKTFNRIVVKNILQNTPDLAIAIVYYFENRILNFLSGEKKLAINQRLKLIIQDLPLNKEGIKSFIEKRNTYVDNIALKNIVQNEIFTSILKISDSVLRTNYLWTHSTIVFKIDSNSLDIAIEPRPLYEIFVYHPYMEGVHLRGGKIARGGLRWSDRQDDYRTEVWGLWKTQVLKNTIIVPTGAKGGFVLKYKSPSLENGIWAYQIFIESLLEMTDGKPAHEIENHFVTDEKDRYLVVAADKGTASFSDYANQISSKNRFWLDDAFASGGRYGYSHKELGITAKGAWESIRWHFFQNNIDIMKQDFSVVGIGDMSGDVFGNGMLATPHIKLKGAFNHKFIFIDPNPDPATSFKERKRMFKEKLQWDQYDKKLISRGGGVFFREEVSIKISSEIAEFLGVEKSSLNGEELIRYLLKAQVDLIFNGGIGTYIKSSSETDADVDDHANDRVRINGADVRATIIGEGGNLGVTPSGRVEFALHGGFINSDAIDNSAGVDLSDHEVNLKILFSILEKKGLIKNRLERNKILKSLSQEEVNLVLQNNFRQNWSLVYQGTLTYEEQSLILEMIELLREKGVIRKSGELLYEINIIREQIHQKQKIPRPVLALIHGYIKLYIQSDYKLDDRIDWKETLYNYFPVSLRNYKKEIDSHPLMKEIAAMALVNDVVDRAGFSYITRSLLYLNLEISDCINYYILVKNWIGIDNLKVSAWLPDIAKRKLPNPEKYSSMVQIKTRIEKAIYRFIEMHILYNCRKEIYSRSLKLETLANESINLKTNSEDYRHSLEKGVQLEVIDLVHIELRFLLEKFGAGFSTKNRDTLAELYLDCGLYDLKKEIYMMPSSNTWEVYSLISVKKHFWDGVISVFKKGTPPVQIDKILKELYTLKGAGKLNISTLSGIVGYLFSRN